MNPSRQYKKTIAQIKRHRTATLARLIAQMWSLNKKGKDVQAATLLCDTFVSLGGVYIKFLQGVLLRSAIMKRWQTTDRLKIFENLGSEPVDINLVLRSELSPQQLDAIKSIQPQPFAAGSFGQVYFGQLKDDTYVVIKLLRPMVRETLPYDLKIIGVFMKNFSKRYYQNVSIDSKSAVKDFKAATMRETDYIAEAEFANEMYQTYKNHPKLKIPRTYMELCSPNIIIQEYIDGISGAQLVKLKEQGVNPKEYIQEHTGSDLDKQLITLGFESLYGSIKYPRIMGDPHPGNVRFLSNDVIGLIDFGIAAKSPDNQASYFAMLKEYDKLFSGRTDVASLFGAFIRFFVSDLYTALKKVSSMIPGGDKVDLLQTIGAIAERNFKTEMPGADFMQMAEDGSILKLVNRIVNKQNRFGLVMKFDDSDILRAAQTYVNLVEILDRRIQVLPSAYGDAILAVNKEFPELEHAQDSQMSVSRALDIVSNWMERIAERDPLLFNELKSKISGVPLPPNKQKNKTDTELTNPTANSPKQPQTSTTNSATINTDQELELASAQLINKEI
jgi:hypothetical protein